MNRSHDAATRRHFLESIAALGAGAGLATAWAQPQAKAPAAGTDYRLVNPAQPTEAAGKIEVIEFFWYACGHCFNLEPLLKDWAKKLPADVVLRKVHVPFNEIRHQQIYYTLQALGKGDGLNDLVFNAIHVERNRMDTPERIAPALAKGGVDAKAFNEAWASFSVQTMMRKATAIASAYKIDSVPMLAVNGRFVTAPSMAGSNGNALAVVDFLADQERKAKR